MKTIFSYLLAIALSLGLVSCSELNISDLATGEALRDRIEAFPMPDIKGISFSNLHNSQSKLSEAAPPILIRRLGKIIDNYRPQVSILEPLLDQVLDDTNVAVRLKVTDFPLFKDENLEMGPHLHFILDNEPYQAIYSVDEPIILENLAPGTHTIRVFAARPWHESFKTQGAYAETTFHILTKTQENNPDSQVPLLTYSRPNGIYGAEPIMLDFYLSHLPSEQIVKNSATEGLPNWRVKATVNGESFIIDQWQPVYLTGFKEGNNWLQLELLDEQGNNIKNIFNNTVRLIAYNPETKDSLARIVTGEIDLQTAIAIVDPNYEIPLEETLQGVSEEALEEEITSESEVIQEDNLPEDQLEVIEEEVNAEAEIIPETSEFSQEKVVEEEIIQQDTTSADNAAVIEEEINTEIEIAPEIPEVGKEQIVVEEEIIQQDTTSADNAVLIEEEINAEIEVAPETPEVGKEQIVVEEEIIQQDTIPADNSEVRKEQVNPEAENISEIPEPSKEEVIAENINTELDIPENNSESVEEKVATREEPFNIRINLDQWVFDHLRQFKDKITELSKLFFE